MMVVPLGGRPKHKWTNFLRYRLIVKAQLWEYLVTHHAIFAKFPTCIYKSICAILFIDLLLRASLLKVIRVAESRAPFFGIQATLKEAKWRTLVHQIQVVNPKNLPWNRLIRLLQSCKREFQILLIYLITNLTKLLTLGKKVTIIFHI